MLFFKKKREAAQIYPDEVFMDSKNVSHFDTQQFEGRLEKPIGKKTFGWLFVFLTLIGLFFFGKIFQTQIVKGESFAIRSEKNNFRKEVIMPFRGAISDRKGVKLAWNEDEKRVYINSVGLAHTLGYIGLPSKEDIKKGNNILLNLAIGKDGVEKSYENYLHGTEGIKLVESDSHGEIISESVQIAPKISDDLVLSIDSAVQSRLFEELITIAEEEAFTGGSGVILDANSGEILAMTNWPEYNVKKIEDSINDKRKPFLNRAISGLYAPGSVIKPMMAIAVLNEKVITPEKRILSTGSISIPNPFFPDMKSVFMDWKAHGWVNLREAISVSSDVYFYEVGGGFEDQKGLGIDKIGEYAKKFGFDSTTGIDLFGEASGVVPSAEIKKLSGFADKTWRVGDTYNASIGQGYFQVTPIAMAVYTASVANGGKLFQPFLVKDESSREGRPLSDPKEITGIDPKHFQVTREGMRMAVETGTAIALSSQNVSVAAKTGTAEVGSGKKYVNSWVIGFWPYEKPKYAFAVVMEKGPYSNTTGATHVMRKLMDWMAVYTPEYLK